MSPTKRLVRRICIATAATVLFGAPVGCASNNATIEQDAMKLTSRVDELERANRQLQVRLDAYEASLTLVEDQMYAVQLANQQSARTNDLDVVRITPGSRPRAAEPEVVAVYPEDDGYGDAYVAEPYPASHGGEYDDIVVSDEKLEKYFGHASSAPAPSAKPVARRSSGTRTPQPAVVAGDRLSVSPMRKDGNGVVAGADPIAFYKQGLKHYRQEQFQPAIELFEKFLAADPPEDYVDNALYWLGECHYGLADYAEAATYFHSIVKEHPNANKVPDALLKVGLTYTRLGKRDSAREALYYLIEAYPDTEAARVAGDRIDKLDAR